MSNTDNQQTTPTTEEQNNTNSTIKNMEDNKWKKWGVILAFIGTLITAGVLIYNANQQHQDKQKEIQLENEKDCEADVGREYETVDTVRKKLDEYVQQIQEMHRKWGEHGGDISVFDENERNQISQIFNDLNFIRDESKGSKEGQALKDAMEMYLTTFYPGVVETGALLSSENYCIVTLANISSREEIPTPNAGRLKDLEDKRDAYMDYYIKFIREEVQNCVNRKKENK